MKEKKMGLIKALFLTGLICLGLLILYLFWQLFVWLINLTGFKNFKKGIRNINRKLQTPVVFYEQPTTKRIVVFIATIHLAESQYFSALQRFIESLSGYKILFENIAKLSLEEEQILTQKERELIGQFNYGFSLIHKLGKIISLQYQRDGLAYSPSWVNADLRLYDLIQSFSQQNIHLIKHLKKEKKLNELFNSEFNQLFARWFINKVFSQFVPVSILISIIFFFSKNKRRAKKFIIDARNEVAIQGINKHLAEGNVAAIWGAGHLRGIEKKLRRAGFYEVRREWFIAYRIRDYNLLKCIKEMFSIKTKVSATTC